MKKQSILNLIRCHAEHNEAGFRSEAAEIAREFDSLGDNELASYIMTLISSAEAFVPQQVDGVVCNSPFLEKISTESDMLLLPDAIVSDILGSVNAVRRRLGANKFMFQGPPGTGKTEAAKQMARLLNRELFLVNTAALVDSKLGQTSKNIESLFRAIGGILHQEKVVVLFDEIDAIALDRTNQQDLREMGRATTEILKGMDRMSDAVVLIATTNLHSHFDKAVMRRFDYVIDFKRYEQKDLAVLAEKFLDKYLGGYELPKQEKRLFRKIVAQRSSLPFPGKLKGMIKSSVAFSDSSNKLDYLHRLYVTLVGRAPKDLGVLREQGFTIREIGVLTAQSKSDVGRQLQVVRRGHGTCRVRERAS